MRFSVQSLQVYSPTSVENEIRVVSLASSLIAR